METSYTSTGWQKRSLEIRPNNSSFRETEVVPARPPRSKELKETFLSTVARLLLLSIFFISNMAVAQGLLTNGWTHTGTIAPAGDADSWTFDASVGDRIVIRIGEINQTGAFNPRIRLLNPNAVQVASVFNSLAAEIAVTATNTGTFTVIADDNSGTVATGSYRLTLVK